MVANKSEFDLILIEEVRKRPILWDRHDDDYKYIDKKPEHWTEIANVLKSGICLRFLSLKSRYLNTDLHADHVQALSQHDSLHEVTTADITSDTPGVVSACTPSCRPRVCPCSA